jgi:hypothetical protein
MRIFVALLVALSVVYFWDVEYNHSTVSDGLINMGRSIVYSWGIRK